MRLRLAILLVVMAGLALAALVGLGVAPLPVFLGGSRSASEDVAPPTEEEMATDEEPADDGGDLAGRPRPASRDAGASAAAPAAAAAAGGPASPVGLDGVVLRGDGRPAVGARVTVIGADGVPTTVVTDAEGRFHLDVPEGRYDLVVRSGFDGALFLRDVLVDGRALAAPLKLGPSSDLAVQVTQDSRAVQDAKVLARLIQDGGAPATVAQGTTDSSGSFLADAIPSGPYVVEVSTAPGVVFSRRLDVSGKATATFAIPPTAQLSGRVADAATRLPVAGAQVAVTVATGDGVTVEAAGTSGPDGVYLLAVPRGRPVSFSVQHPDYAPFPTGAETGPVLSSLAVLRTQDSVVRDALLHGGAVVSGTVVMAGSKDPVPDLSLRFAQDRTPFVRTATTREDGTYEVHGLSAGPWRALIETAGWYVQGANPVVRVPAPGADGSVAPTVLDLTVWSAGTVSGVVVTPDGAPAAGARVWLVGGSGAVRYAQRAGRTLEALTAADGSFSLEDVPPADWLRVRAALGEAEATPSAPFRLADGAPPPFRLVLAPTGTITGRVTDQATREPVAAARVQADPVGEPGGRAQRVVLTGSDGRFELPGLIQGGWRLTPNKRPVYLPGEPQAVDLKSESLSQDVALLLDPGLAIGGVVVDGGGNPLPGARVFLEGVEDQGNPPAMVRRGGVSDARGAFRWTGLRPGAYAARARRGGLQPAYVDRLRGGEERLRLVLLPAPPPPR